MEAEPLELEEGELVDDEPEDVFGGYKVLERPHIVPQANDHVKTKYSDESDLSADPESNSHSENDTDSDAGYAKNKRPKLKIKRCKKSQNRHSENDKYKVWCTQVQEESLTEDLISCGVTRNLYQERSVETYNFPMTNSRKGSNFHNNSSDDEREVDRRFTNKRTNSDRHNVKLRLGKRRNSVEKDSPKGDARVIGSLSTTANSTDAEVATDITAKLNEQKDVLIRRVVDIIGKQKAIDFFHKTKEIEEDGGMLIMNGSRRRTAGGVYLWLVKNDEHIPQEKIREIFYHDKKEHVEQRKKVAADIRRQKAQELIKSIENGSDKDLPALLTRAELSTKQIAEEARLRRGEGMDRMPVDSDCMVTNPPPSPVTDDPDHTENSVMHRQVQDYSDDFLDVGVDIDSMEVL